MELRALAAIPNVNSGSDQRSGYDASRTMLPTNRALVLPIAAADFAGRGFSSSAAQHYGDAAFITHLIATAHGVPQTRSGRRAEPDCAISAYAATSRCALRVGQAISETR